MVTALFTLPCRWVRTLFCYTDHQGRNTVAAVLAVGVLWVAGVPACAAPDNPGVVGEPARPDIVLIMVDDMGYADLGCYGGEIDTPNLDAMANHGVRFSQFRVAPMCVVSRVALLSGLPMNGGGDQAYSKTVPFPSLLKDAGYTTGMAGKWHAGRVNPRSPELFDSFFGHMGGMTDCFVGGPDWFINNKPFNDFGPDFYSTDALTDHGIAFMQKARKTDQPAFLFISYNAPHHPCQAPQETVEKYTERYQRGYQAIREDRLAKQKAMGLIEDHWAADPPPSEVRRWDEMPEDRQRIEADRMAAYSAMVDEIDQNVGRLMADIRASGRADRTVVMFISDNGGDYSNGSWLTDDKQVPWKPGANPTPSNGWAWVKNTPFRSYKHSSFEGALASPLIVHMPQGLKLEPGTIIADPAHITDLYPTLLKLAEAEYPKQHKGKQLAPLAGASLLPLLIETEATRESKPAFAWYNTSRAWIEDGWKAVQLYDGPWQLYDLNVDRGETNDLASAEADRLRGMVQQYNAQADPPAKAKPALPGPNASQHGWGWHRLQNITKKKLVALHPDNSATRAATDTTLELTFNAPAAFLPNNAQGGSGGGRGIKLYAVADETKPVWEAYPNASHPSQGKRKIVFDDLPELQPDADYFVITDPGWVKVGGQPMGPLNNGAFWWRFRTAGEK